MTYLLDTNVCIRLLNNTSPTVTTRLAAQEPENIYLCTVVQMELVYGAYRSANLERNLALLEQFFSQFSSLPLDEPAARVAGQVRAQLAALGTPIGPYDVQIAAIALVNNLILVTHNTGEFGRVNGLQIEDWEEVR
ncbi:MULTISPECIES: type II toxin-antitoxin system tRNA(fMet)-specific endonuclease VapC [unclassified Coleofasciculus]|uniref:type II toxin-antitoxin system tRNA(fMet)-specific endonuclease VapC n=1 Tax=unclassified Coleofasciculus TaxID=2692782 RepID=UPI001881D482|nr:MULTISPECIES: type II toxin-antitoxin system VapC family toxin [unclassified Coleofasciculus]MBE9130006.1 type II toxin-antitoxin system VapC family toxin [Coleofasciculus sp. LEGE 07081]MBE9152368.1 type II toxin-antitoxin system VapC family toxin [Coleofasciculus sp. LEGE 07092]